HALGVVGAGAHRYIHSCAVGRERNIARGVAADWQSWYYRFGVTARREIVAAIWETQDGVGVGDVNPLRVSAGWIKGDAERVLQPRCRHGLHRSRAAIWAHDADAAGLAFSDKYVAVRRSADNPRTS